MKKITILVVTILALGFILSSCQFVAGLLPTIGGTIWSYSTTIDGTAYNGTLYFGKRTNSFSSLDGTITVKAPNPSTKLFTGHADRYILNINPINLGGNRAIKFEGEVHHVTHSTMIAGSKIFVTDDITADPVVWEEGVWTGTMLDK